MIGFIFYFAALGAILSVSLLLPSVVAFGIGEADIGVRILLYGFAGGFLSIAVLLSIAGREIALERRKAALLVVTSWVLFPLIVTVPLTNLTELGFIPALFQAVSSFTTTGSMVFVNPEAVPRTVIFMLAQFQWLGGIASLITFILILSPWEIGGLPKASSASETASIVASQYRLARFSARLFRGIFGLTILCFVLLLMTGLAPFESMVLSMTALSTGGIVPGSGNLDEVLGYSGMIVMAAFLMISGTSIFWHRNLISLNIPELLKHRESYFLVIAWFVMTLVLMERVISASGEPATFSRLADAFGEGIMNAASLLTTSGIQTREGIFALLAPSLVIFLVFAGSGCFSTAGGVKYFRIGVVCWHARHELDKLVFPSSVHAFPYSGGKIGLSLLKSIWGLITIWILVLVLGSLLLNITGLDFQAALTAATAALSNAGPVYGTYWNDGDLQGWTGYADMNHIQLSILIVLMFLGRLEIILVFASLGLLLRRSG